jgi:hypothetical protein
MSLQGQLRDFGVADVFQLIAQQRKTGVLEVEEQGNAYLVSFEEGAVVRARPREKRTHGALAEYLVRTGAISEPDLAESHRVQEETLEPLANLLLEAGLITPEGLASVGALITDEVIFELFLLDDGKFRFRPQAVEREPGDEAIGAEQVLLDALRMRDEWEQVRHQLPDSDTVPTPLCDIESFQGQRDRVESASGVRAERLERLFTLCDGRLSARRVLDLSRLGAFEGGRGLVALRREGLISLEAPIALPSPTARRAGSRQAQSWLPLLALGAAALVTSLLLIQPARHPEPSLPADGLAAARRAADLERARVEAEAARWREGGYPERLAAASGGRYLYERTERGYALYPDLP